MSFADKNSSEAVEALVDTLSTGATITDANLSLLSTTDLQQLAELSEDLSANMETQEPEMMETEEIVVQPEPAQKIEVETQVAEEILPDIKAKTNLPPLRPLTIAPKPAKVPIALKPVTGQQLLLLQGGGGTQAIKLQGVSLANLSIGKPVTLRPTVKSLGAPGNLSVVQPKQFVMKKLIMQAEKGKMEQRKPEQQIKIITSQGGSGVTPTKTITLAQAQQMGLLTGTKLVPQGKQMFLNKGQAKAIKIVPQMKSPTKILPAPQTTVVGKGPQRIILKQAGGIVTPTQLIQVTGAPGQVHQINIPGKGVQYIKFVTATTSNSTVTTTTTTSGTQKVLNATPVTMKTIKPAVRQTPVQIPQTTQGQLVMLPATYLPQSGNAKVPIPAKASPAKLPSNDAVVPVAEPNLENGIRPRKPCNCTKSQCLKLYCDCFANGEFCYMCNCMNCFNNLENEEHRQRAIKSCLERNPNAFRPKIGKAKDTADNTLRKHTKGCNCKRSGCLKNYCECYEAKIACSSNCKCMGCRNIENSMEKKNGRPPSVAEGEGDGGNAPHVVSKISSNARDFLMLRPRRSSNSKQAFNFITNDVIEATCQCLLTLSDSAENNAQDAETTKKEIIEEFGRCLKEIINCSMKSS